MNEGFIQRGDKIWVKKPKDPDAKLDYGMDWTDWLKTDTITDSIWEVSSPDLIMSNPSKTNTVTTVWLAGGVAEKVYIYTNRITTALGRIQEQSFRLKVKEN